MNGEAPAANAAGEVTSAATGGPSLRLILGWLAAGTLLAFFVVFGVGSLALGSALRRVEEQQVAERVRRARLLVQHRGSERAATIREYGWWTETWRFIDAPRTPASAAFLKANFLDWLPSHYGDRLIGVWALDGRRVFLWTDSSAQGAEAAFESPDRFAFVARTKASGGLVVAPRGLLLAGFSVVVTTEDQTATGPWHGYVALARPVDSTLLAEWGAALQERIRLLPLAADSSIRGDEVVSRRYAGGDSVETRFLVNGLFEAPVAVAVLSASRDFVTGLRWQVISIIGAAAAVGVAVIVLLFLIGHRALVRPLARMALALGRMRGGGRLLTLDAPSAAREWSVFSDAFNETVHALRASEERYRILFQQGADALFVVEGTDERIADANPAAERLTGCPREQLVGRPLSAFLVPAVEGSDLRGPCRLLRDGRPGAAVEVVTGEIEFGTRRGTLASVRDLTEREALEEQLRQAQKMEVLGRLAGGIAHDFNNLLGAVLVSASGLRVELEPDHPAQASIETIQRAARRASELTRQLLSFARREGVRREPVAVADLVAGVRALCLRTFGHSVEIVACVESEGAAVLGDAVQLEQALLNLCINARDAMPDGGTLTIRAAVTVVDESTTPPAPGVGAGRFVVLTVSDTGVGMSAEVQAHLFEPFFTTKERGKGTGLGLATTYGIVRGHGGALRVCSEPGHGSSFAIYLPESRVMAVAPVVPPTGALPRGTETVLLVDDEADLRRTVGRGLARLGYQVVAAANGREAVARFSERPDDIRLVLLDLLMPEMGGVEAFRAIRALRPAARILVFTGFASETEIQRLVEGGAEGVMPKPFEIAELAATVRRVLDRRDAPRVPEPAA